MKLTLRWARRLGVLAVVLLSLLGALSLAALVGFLVGWGREAQRERARGKGPDRAGGRVERCVTCHGCTTTPCQLKLTSYEGVMRGYTYLGGPQAAEPAPAPATTPTPSRVP